MAAQGALTEVYLARPEGSGPRLAAPYAIKMLKRECEGDGRAAAMLRREALVGRAISHPHLVSILSANVSRPPYYLVMPWLTGRTLAARLGADGPLGVPEAIWIARQVAEALGALAEAGWMHGDVKPSNIFLSPEGHVTLLDLGFAQRIGRSDPASERCLTGTANYMAPEAFLTTLPVDMRSDLYSLGAVLLEMLTGRPPFSGSNPEELSRQHREARAAGLKAVAARMPEGAASLLRQLLAKQPLRRPQSPREVVERLVPLEIATLQARLAALPD